MPSWGELAVIGLSREGEMDPRCSRSAALREMRCKIAAGVNIKGRVLLPSSSPPLPPPPWPFPRQEPQRAEGSDGCRRNFLPCSACTETKPEEQLGYQASEGCVGLFFFFCACWEGLIIPQMLGWSVPGGQITTVYLQRIGCPVGKPSFLRLRK